MYNLFRPKPAITEPPSKRQRVERDSSQPSTVPAATTQPADDHDSAGGSSFHPAGSATPMSGSAVPDTAGGPLAYYFSDDRGIMRFSWISDDGELIGLSRVAAKPDSDDEVLAEILFRGQYVSGAGVVVCGQTHKMIEIVDPRRRDESVLRLNPDVDVGLDLWRDVQSVGSVLHSEYVEDFWRTQDEWVVSSWKLYPRSSVHVLDLTNGKTVYMFVGNVYPIRATLLERMLRHRLTVPPSYCRDVVVAGSVIQTVQAGLRESYECLASAPLKAHLLEDKQIPIKGYRERQSQARFGGMKNRKKMNKDYLKSDCRMSR
ncbi:hypothetical protein Tco_0017031 [Tanacetum coccineum]